MMCVSVKINNTQSAFNIITVSVLIKQNTSELIGEKDTLQITLSLKAIKFMFKYKTLVLYKLLNFLLVIVFKFKIVLAYIIE